MQRWQRRRGRISGEIGGGEHPGLKLDQGKSSNRASFKLLEEGDASRVIAVFGKLQSVDGGDGRQRSGSRKKLYAKVCEVAASVEAAKVLSLSNGASQDGFSIGNHVVSAIVATLMGALDHFKRGNLLRRKLGKGAF